MLITVALIEAARHAELNYYARGRALGSRFTPTPDEVIKVMLTAAFALIENAAR